MDTVKRGFSVKHPATLTYPDSLLVKSAKARGSGPAGEAVPVFSTGTVFSLVLLRAILMLAASLCGALLLQPISADAHSVYIFAWVDGPRICTQSYFSKSSRVKNGDVRMADSRGDVLHRGRSGVDGVICFPPPESAQDLVFTVNAGQGHRGEFLLPASDVQKAVDFASEVTQGSGPAPGSDSVNATAPSPPQERPSPATPGSSAHAPVSTGLVTSREPSQRVISREELRGVIREEMRRQLSPVLQSLAEKNNNERPGFRDILGGIGWIFGLAAAGSLYYNRKNRS